MRMKRNLRKRVLLKRNNPHLNQLSEIQNQRRKMKSRKMKAKRNPLLNKNPKNHNKQPRIVNLKL